MSDIQSVPQELVEKLRKPLPNEAVTKHPTKSYLSSIKAIYVVERLNDVFGLGGWKIKNELVELYDFKKSVKGAEVAGTMVVMKATLTVPQYGIEFEAYGGNDNDDRGDAYKGACTDALTKIGSYMFIGMEVYKGIHGSQAAADAVAKRTIEQLTNGRDYRDIKSEAGAVSPDLEEKLKQSNEAVKPADTQRKPFNIGASCEEFAKLKAMGMKELGPAFETEYYRILSLYNVKHANQLKSAKPAREAYRMLASAYDSLLKLKQSDATDEPDDFDRHVAQEAEAGR